MHRCGFVETSFALNFKPPLLPPRGCFCFDDAFGSATLLAGVARFGVIWLHIKACLRCCFSRVFPLKSGKELNEDELDKRVRFTATFTGPFSSRTPKT